MSDSTYTKEEFLKAAEIGEVSMIDAMHVVSLLDEARQKLNYIASMEAIKERYPATADEIRAKETDYQN